VSDERNAALVTGGAGFIGSHVARTLIERGWRVDVLDNLSAGDAGSVPNGATLHVGDLRSDGDVAAILSRTPFAVVVHCAAQTSVERSMRDPALDWDVNVGGTRRLAEWAKREGAARFVFLSSGGAIYGETTGAAGEHAATAPRGRALRRHPAAFECLRPRAAQ
jgi:UDP-glucose 4-epimerase